jgi:RimJ/RimL family protein N-acetyltransferase
MPGSEPCELRTERLVLRPFRADDAEAIARYADDEDYRRYLSPMHPGPEEFVAHNVAADWSVERPWVITLDGATVGSVFLGINSEEDAAELECLVAPASGGGTSHSKRRAPRSSTLSSISSCRRWSPGPTAGTRRRSD